MIYILCSQSTYIFYHPHNKNHNVDGMIFSDSLKPFKIYQKLINIICKIVLVNIKKINSDNITTWILDHMRRRRRKKKEERSKFRRTIRTVEVVLTSEYRSHLVLTSLVWLATSYVDERLRDTWQILNVCVQLLEVIIFSFSIYRYK